MKSSVHDREKDDLNINYLPQMLNVSLVYKINIKLYAFCQPRRGLINVNDQDTRYRKGKEGATQTKEVPHWGLSKDMPRVTTGENQTSYLSNQVNACTLCLQVYKFLIYQLFCRLNLAGKKGGKGTAVNQGSLFRETY